MTDKKTEYRIDLRFDGVITAYLIRKYKRGWWFFSWWDVFYEVPIYTGDDFTQAERAIKNRVKEEWGDQVKRRYRYDTHGDQPDYP